MTDYWTQMSTEYDSATAPYLLSRSGDVTNPNCGYRVYALQKADMYRRIGVHAEKCFLDPKVGGAWPDEKEDINEFLRKRRPRLEVDWQKDGKDFEQLVGNEK